MPVVARALLVEVSEVVGLAWVVAWVVVVWAVFLVQEALAAWVAELALVFVLVLAVLVVEVLPWVRLGERALPEALEVEEVFGAALLLVAWVAELALVFVLVLVVLAVLAEV